MARIVGVVVGFLLFFPGALILQWLTEELRLYEEMTLTDALMAMIIILACVLIFGQPRRALTAEELERQAKAMELASRRLEQAQRTRDQLRRRRRPSRTAAPDRDAAPSRRASARRTSRADDQADRRRHR
ncbi:MAG: hypothetical protein AB7Y46_15885 [Armatimonadota bacterium]